MKPICKKPFLIPENKPYPWKKHLVWYALLLLLSIWAALLFSGCSNAYKKIEKTPPLTEKDSARLSARFLSTYPTKPAKVLPGKTIVKTVTKIDSSKVKSLQDRINKLIDDNVFQNQLLNQVPDYDSLTIIEKERVDTLYQDKPETIAAINVAINQKNEAQRELIKTTAERDIYHNQANRWWLWLVIGLFFGGVSVKVIGAIIKMKTTMVSK